MHFKDKIKSKQPFCFPHLPCCLYPPWLVVVLFPVLRSTGKDHVKQSIPLEDGVHSLPSKLYSLNSKKTLLYFCWPHCQRSLTETSNYSSLEASEGFRLVLVVSQALLSRISCLTYPEQEDLLLLSHLGSQVSGDKLNLVSTQHNTFYSARYLFFHCLYELLKLFFLSLQWCVHSCINSPP